MRISAKGIMGQIVKILNLENDDFFQIIDQIEPRGLKGSVVYRTAGNLKLRPLNFVFPLN